MNYLINQSTAIWISKDGNETGPFTPEQIHGMIKGGLIGPGDYLWPDALGNYIQIKNNFRRPLYHWRRPLYDLHEGWRPRPPTSMAIPPQSTIATRSRWRRTSRFATAIPPQSTTANQQVLTANQQVLTANQQVIVPRQQNKSNGIGLAGFVLAILGLLTLLTPLALFGTIFWLLGLIFSFVGIFKSPRGFAIAGLIVSFFVILICLILLGLGLGALVALISSFQ